MCVKEARGRKVACPIAHLAMIASPSDRSFIFGTGPAKMNAMFPEGVVYEGVSEEPMCFRGESGANDSLVPLGDNVLELTAHMPDNELTKTLRDFRSYRPQSQRHYIAGLEFRASQAGVRRFALEGGSAKAKALYVLLVDQIREFRSRYVAQLSPFRKTSNEADSMLDFSNLQSLALHARVHCKS